LHVVSTDIGVAHHCCAVGEPQLGAEVLKTNQSDIEAASGVIAVRLNGLSQRWPMWGQYLCNVAKSMTNASSFSRKNGSGKNITVRLVATHGAGLKCNVSAHLTASDVWWLQVSFYGLKADAAMAAQIFEIAYNTVLERGQQAYGGKGAGKMLDYRCAAVCMPRMHACGLVVPLSSYFCQLSGRALHLRESGCDAHALVTCVVLAARSVQKGHAGRAWHWGCCTSQSETSGCETSSCGKRAIVPRRAMLPSSLTPTLLPRLPRHMQAPQRLPSRAAGPAPWHPQC
jgi:hypothetical protein